MKNLKKNETETISENQNLYKKSKSQKFEIATIGRSELKNAPYNPRVISPDAMKRLKKNIKQVGLIQPIIWNKRTGNIVGGHQRIAALDAIEKSENYSLDVAVVDFDEKTEREQNIALNNDRLFGDFDLNLLENVFNADDFKIDFENTGFDFTEISFIMPEVAKKNEMNNILEIANNEDVKEDLEHIQKIKDIKKKSRDVLNKKNDYAFYATIVFQDREEKEAFLVSIGKPPDYMYIDAEYLKAYMINQGDE